VRRTVVPDGDAVTSWQRGGLEPVVIPFPPPSPSLGQANFYLYPDPGQVFLPLRLFVNPSDYKWQEHVVEGTKNCLEDTFT